MSVGHNAKTAAEAGLQPWLHGGSELEGGCGGGEAACARLSIRKSSIGLRRALDAPFAEVLPKDRADPHTTLREISDLPRRSTLRTSQRGRDKQASRQPSQSTGCRVCRVTGSKTPRGSRTHRLTKTHRLNRKVLFIGTGATLMTTSPPRPSSTSSLQLGLQAPWSRVASSAWLFWLRSWPLHWQRMAAVACGLALFQTIASRSTAGVCCTT